MDPARTPTASDFLAEIDRRLRALERSAPAGIAALETYTPTLTSTGTAPAGHTTRGRFYRSGDLGWVAGSVTLGATVGTGEYRVSLPSGWTPLNITGLYWQGSGRALDVSAGTGYQIVPVTGTGSTVIGLNWPTSTGAFAAISSASPFSMVAGDSLSWSLWLALA